MKIMTLALFIVGLAAPIPGQVTDAEALAVAVALHEESVIAVTEALGLVDVDDGGLSVQQVEFVVAEGIRRMDEDVSLRECFKAWWASARSSFEFISLVVRMIRTGDTMQAMNFARDAGVMVYIARQALPVAEETCA